MNGAESLIRTFAAGGVEVCFANPGTSEMHIVAALDRTAEMRCILALFEGVVTGAADGYARMASKPACTLLHLGPSLANGLANLHNASRAHSPIINMVGQHPSYHIGFDTPLTSDIESIARPYSQWLRTSSAAAEVSRDALQAIVAARQPPGKISTLIIPADVAWGEVPPSESEGSRQVCTSPVIPMPAGSNIERAASMLRSGSRTAILLNGAGLYGKGLAAAGRIAAGTNAKLLAPYPFPRMQRGAGFPQVDRIHYVLEQAVEQLKDFRQLILVGAPPPVCYFAYPGKNSVPTRADCEIHTLANPSEDSAGALEALAGALSLPKMQSGSERAENNGLPGGEINAHGIAQIVGALLPENAVVVDESMTSGRGLMASTKASPPHDWLANTGGSIGIAMPLAVGAAIACPDRRIICLSADGSGMYTAQALWTMARESLRITTVIFANRAYAVLKREFSALGIGEPGPRASALFDIGRPDLDWTSLAKGMGVPATRPASLEDFAKDLRRNLESSGPALIEVRL